MLGFLILVLFNLLGWALHHWAHVPLPENVLGMLLLLAALCSGVVKLHWVEDSALLLLRHMMLFFAPIIVGVIPLLQTLEDNLVAVVGGLIISTLATMLVTAFVADTLIGRPRAVDA